MKRIVISGSWLSRRVVTIILGVAVAAVGTLIFIQHKAHLAGLLPFAAILLCPLMHIFMHGKHSGHGRESRSSEGDAPSHRHGGEET